jgi:hypothetical protein
MNFKVTEGPPVPGGDSHSIERDRMLDVVSQELGAARLVDIHTHLFMPSLGVLGLWGIDELLTYHYLEAEFFRSSSWSPSEYFRLSKREQADAVWRALFVENTPVSDAARGVICVLEVFGLSTTRPDLREARQFFAEQELGSHIHRVFDLAGVSEVVMTNDPLDPQEATLWEQGVEPDPQFHPALRLDRLLNEWAGHWPVLVAKGYRVSEDADGNSIAEVRRFLADWCGRMKPLYMAVSLPDTFQYPEDSIRARLLSQAALPVCRELGMPLSLMIGVRRQVNPKLRLAGDGVGRADLRSVERLCVEHPENRFLASLLSRENQHELCVCARKFSNLMPFGCWWFLNQPSIVEEITRERLEMLGTSFIPQHSDARVLEQVLYKWRNTRRTLAPLLAKTYLLLQEDGRPVTRADIRRDVRRLFRTNFERLTGLGRSAAPSVLESTAAVPLVAGR